MKYLITGAAGFIGSNLVHLLKKEHPNAQILIVDKLGIGSDLKNIENRYDGSVDLSIADITNYELIKGIIGEFSPDYLVHAAAESHVDRSIDKPHSFVETNIIGTLNILEAVKSNDQLIHKTKITFVSTDEVYGQLGPLDDPFVEDLKHKPSSVYSASKSAGEALVHAYIKTYGMNISITNCSNNFGPRQHEEKFIPKTIKSILNGTPVIVYGDGSNIRDWIYVDDHNEALLKIIHGGLIGKNYNIGGDNERTNLQIVEDIRDIIFSKPYADYINEFSSSRLSPMSIEFVADRKGHDTRYAVNYTVISEEFGWKPDTKKYTERLQETVKWYVDKFLKEGK
jgi:dTDP-glucose 4,6-dehydratase